MDRINCFIPYISPEQVKPTVDELRSTGLTDKIYLMTSNPEAEPYEGCEILNRYIDQYADDEVGLSAGG